MSTYAIVLGALPVIVSLRKCCSLRLRTNEHRGVGVTVQAEDATPKGAIPRGWETRNGAPAVSMNKQPKKKKKKI